MADHMLFIGWGEAVRGREERALEVFNETVGLYGRMQQDGRIDSFDVRLLEPNGDLAGYMELRGSGAQIGALRDDEEFRRTMVDAALIVENLRMVDGRCNEGVASEMEMYQAALAKVPQRT